VHRDVKPSNVMLAGAGLSPVKLVDLGIARRTGDPGRLTATGAVVGTAGYLAPELVRGGAAAFDGRADLFALGCVLHECFTGAVTFRGDNTLAVCAKVMVHDPPTLRSLDPSVPPALDALVSSLLARPPDQRPDSAASVERILTGLGAVPDASRRTGAAARTRPGPGATLDGLRRDVCGVLVVGAGRSQPAALPAVDPSVITAAPFEDGLVVIVAGQLAAAVQIGLAIATASPDALIVVASGESSDDCIDRCARALADIELAGQLADHGRGVWIAHGARCDLAGGFRVAVSGVHARILGVAGSSEVT
ncbi:MAG TPA: serine/threonine-protein kinase, partial [Kofleriaceae bacterium]